MIEQDCPATDFPAAFSEFRLMVNCFMVDLFLMAFVLLQ